jgi:hypothetical protein
MIKTAAQSRASHSAHGHSVAGHGGPHTSRPMAEVVWPARSGTVGLDQPSKQHVRPAAERPMTHGAGERVLLCGAARCSSAARWPRWKMSAGVSTDAERWTCRARSQGWGLTEEVARWWGGGENSTRRRSAAGEARTVAGVAPRHSWGSARVRER